MELKVTGQQDLQSFRSSPREVLRFFVKLQSRSHSCSVQLFIQLVEVVPIDFNSILDDLNQEVMLFSLSPTTHHPGNFSRVQGD